MQMIGNFWAKQNLYFALSVPSPLFKNVPAPLGLGAYPPALRDFYDFSIKFKYF